MTKKVSVIYPKATPKKEHWLIVPFKKFWHLILAIGAIGGVVTFADWGKEKSKSDHEKFKEEKFVKGILVPYEILQRGQNLIGYGRDSGFTVVHSVSELRRGVESTLNQYSCFEGTKNPLPLRFKLDGDRLFVSDTIRHYKTGNIIGILNYNEWELRKDKISLALRYQSNIFNWLSFCSLKYCN